MMYLLKNPITELIIKKLSCWTNAYNFASVFVLLSKRCTLVTYFVHHSFDSLLFSVHRLCSVQSAKTRLLFAFNMGETKFFP